MTQHIHSPYQEMVRFVILLKVKVFHHKTLLYFLSGAF